MIFKEKLNNDKQLSIFLFLICFFNAKIHYCFKENKLVEDSEGKIFSKILKELIIVLTTFIMI